MSPPLDGPLPLTLLEARAILEALARRVELTALELRAIEVTQRHASRGRASSSSHTDAVIHLIDAREHQRASLEALDRAIGTATTATETPSASGT
jgi:hypothetical protein